MKELLSLLPRPSHYIGTEEGSVHKEPASVRLHCALAFPDLYEVGMSYLGHKILYTILNNREDIFAERVYAPCRETGRLLREHGVSLATLESDTDIVKTHMFAFAITHELCFTNVLYMLELSAPPIAGTICSAGPSSSRAADAPLPRNRSPRSWTSCSSAKARRWSRNCATS